MKFVIGSTPGLGGLNDVHPHLYRLGVRRVVAQVVRESLTVILMGAAVGWIAVFVVSAHINQGAPFDFVAFAGVPALLLAIAAIACWIPARRAASVDPMLALRQD